MLLEPSAYSKFREWYRWEKSPVRGGEGGGTNALPRERSQHSPLSCYGHFKRQYHQLVNIRGTLITQNFMQYFLTVHCWRLIQNTMQAK